MTRKTNTDPIQAWMKILKKKLKKRAFRMKVKIVLSVVLPGAIVLLGTATARIFLRMALRKAGSGIKTDLKEKKQKKTKRGDGILAWPEHEDAAGTVSNPEESDTECIGRSDAETTDAADAVNAAESIRPEPVVLESSRPDFVTPETAETEVLK